ncbi:NAD(P)H-dependent oxidoreductase [Roseicyclus persicicus]|uniref:NAD(P)H-dependent oxidoreductase n=1 Tax=Roseicyclus persicicus TaxID=2650661 RepID=A0A7X6GZ47_9RHOB|nr:NAD(P)H-dependent oxidoreductase [Roseibacterium persicicum]NKX45018.1 NAD(P)H-dependent oxidoreductase [Roseibacterium persicicum]
MQTQRILVLDGHPAPASLSRSLAETYSGAARQAGHEVRLLHLSEMDFDLDFGRAGYRDVKPLEPALEGFMADLAWSGHVVVMAPLWWGGLPAKLKALFDRAFLPGTAFDPRRPNRLGVPAPLLTGRSARLVITSDTPGWWQRLVYRRAIAHQVTRQIFGFVGIRPTRHSWFAPASHAGAGVTGRWLSEMAALGRAAA